MFHHFSCKPKIQYKHMHKKAQDKTTLFSRTFKSIYWDRQTERQTDNVYLSMIKD